MASATNTRTFGASLAETVRAFVATQRAAAAQRKVYQATIAELQSLSDRELSDLGIARSNIRSIAHEAAYDK